MKILNKALRVLLCASLVCSIGISAAACDVDDSDQNTGIVTPGGDNEGNNPSGGDQNTPGGDNEGNKPGDGDTNTPGGDDDGNEGDKPGDGNTDPEVKTYTVSFDAKGGSAVASQIINQGNAATKPAAPTRPGYLFQNWYTDEGCNNAYTFGSAVNADITLYAKWTQLDAKIQSITPYNESFQITWAEGAPDQAKVSYKATGSADWTVLDSNLVTTPASGEARADIIGLNPTQTYDIKIETAGTTITQNEIAVEAYDRSGYAHFNYSDGVGAYNDDGTLKEGALVIYVTDSNKNDVTDYVYKNTANGLVKEDISEYIKPGKPTLEGKDLGGETYGGIGYILNNRGYDNGTERESYGIQKLTFTYGAVAVRILGTVVSEYNGDAPTVHGLTYYAKSGNINPFTGVKYAKGVSVPNGGTVGDNGQMARITNAKNLTIEGIGEDAGIYGWGIHFVSNDNLQKYNGEAGKSFEVRNLTFENYPEDAIGMEGTQGIKVDATGSITQEGNASTARIISGVERCWIHNNTFLPGFCAKPAESDKGEGDGSCDFKRGQYYTLSYNYFEYCHKTNLIGSSDDSLQFNMTMHHNWWYNCGSRVPLLRNGNVHFYNNYVYGDANDSLANMSYVHSMRANSYLFSEANFYDGSKQVTRKESETGRAKGYNNILYSCYEMNEMIAVDTRDQKITNTCKYSSQNIDLSAFDTTPALFYYDAANKVSDCLLDDPAAARIKVIENAGVNGFTGRIGTKFISHTPTSAVQVGEDGLTIDLSKVGKTESTVSNVYFAANNGYSNGLKIRGQGIIFTLTAETELSVAATGTDDDCLAQLVRENGTPVIGEKFSDLTIVLPAGTYIIASGKKDKDTYITKLEFADTASSSSARLEAAEAAINALPATVVSDDDVQLVINAEHALSALTASEREKFLTQNASAIEKLDAAKASRDDYFVAKVIALIDDIGTVTADSHDKIEAANLAYLELDASLQSKVTNYPTLQAALSAFANLRVQVVIDDIDALTDVTGWTAETKTLVEVREALEAYSALMTRFEDMSEENQALITNISKLENGLSLLTALEAELETIAANAQKLADFREALAAIDTDDCTNEEVIALVGKYNGLGEAVDELTADENSKYQLIKKKFDELQSKSVECAFDGSIATPAGWTVSGKTTNKQTTINGKTYTSALKSESSTSVKFTTGSAKMQLTIYFTTDCAGKVIEINGKGYTAAAEGDNVVVTCELEPETEYTISKGRTGTTNTFLVLLTLVPIG